MLTWNSKFLCFKGDTETIYFFKKNTKLKSNKYPLTSQFCIPELGGTELASWGTGAKTIQRQLGAMENAPV